VRWPWRRQWSVRLIGQHSGLVGAPITFLTFRTKEQAEDWIQKVDRNREWTRYEPCRLDEVDPDVYELDCGCWQRRVSGGALARNWCVEHAFG
jgi:hypothetical protein